MFIGPDLEHSRHAVKGSKYIASVDFIELIGVQDIFIEDLRCSLLMGLKSNGITSVRRNLLLIHHHTNQF